PRTRGQWHRRTWALAWPTILANSSEPLVGVVDTAVVGQLPGATSIGAVAVGAAIFNFLFWGFGFLRLGTTGFTAQAVGAGDLRMLGASYLRAVLLALGLGVALVAAQTPVLSLALWAMQGSEQVEALADVYCRWRIWSAPGTFLNYVALGFLIGAQRPGLALFVQLTLNLCNIGLDLLFVSSLQWGVSGVAAATLLSQYLAVAVGLLACRRVLTELGVSLRGHDLFEPRALLRLLRVNTDLFLRNLGVILAFFVFTSTGSQLGDRTLAANAILIHFQQIMAYGLDGFAFAAQALAGAAYGAGDRVAFRNAVRTTSQWAAGVALVYMVIYAVAGSSLVQLLSSDPSVREAALRLLPWVVLSPLVCVWSFQLDGIFVGTTRTREMRNAMLASLALYLLALYPLLSWLDEHGLWLALMGFMLARAATLMAYYPQLRDSVGASGATAG
ncbi:MAG: MATE family efflux transporter, partial [Gammaproteobacteria bacterium]|nr:MATE family efflux transporter [Gammaproteobacteria bacterium]